ncbi:MAG: hypothetical protein AAFX05_13975 [Planctomycetota bacterium]
MSTVLAAFVIACCLAAGDATFDVEVTPVEAMADVDIGVISELRHVRTHVDDEAVDGIVVVGTTGAAVLREEDLSLVSQVTFRPFAQLGARGHHAILNAEREIIGFVQSSEATEFPYGMEVYTATGAFAWREAPDHLFTWIAVADVNGDGEEDILCQAEPPSSFVRAATIDKKQISFQRWGQMLVTAQVDIDADGQDELASLSEGNLIFRDVSGEVRLTIELPGDVSWNGVSAHRTLADPPEDVLVLGGNSDPMEWHRLCCVVGNDLEIAECDLGPEDLFFEIVNDRDGRNFGVRFLGFQTEPQLIVRDEAGRELRRTLLVTQGGERFRGDLVVLDKTSGAFLFGSGNGLWRCEVVTAADAAD